MFVVTGVVDVDFVVLVVVGSFSGVGDSDGLADSAVVSSAVIKRENPDELVSSANKTYI